MTRKIVLAEGHDITELRKYGFKPGSEYFGKERWCGDGSGYGYQADWWHAFLTYDPETWEMLDDPNQGEILYAQDDIPTLQLTFRTFPENPAMRPDLYIDAAVSSTYHVGGDELGLIPLLVIDMLRDGVIDIVVE